MTTKSPVTIHTLLSYVAILFVIMYLVGSLLLNNFGVDGTCYAAIARNMALGFGTPWAPIYSLSQHNPFYEHPSLGLIIYSSFFSFFGDKPYTEHVYATTIAALTLCWLVLLWRAFYFKKEKRYPRFDEIWSLLFCWFCVPYLAYYAISGGLELLADLFAVPSIYLLFQSCQTHVSTKKCQGLMVLSATSLFLSFVINGPLTLFPLSFYLLYWFTYQDKPLFHYVKCSLMFIGYFLMIGSVFFYFFPNALDNFIHYWDQAVNGAVFRQRYDAKSSGFFYFKALIVFIEQFRRLLMVPVLLFIAIYFMDKKTVSQALDKHLVGNKEALLTLLIAMSATLPISLSPKQSLYYTQQGGFFLVLSCCNIITPLVNIITQKITLPLKLNRQVLKGIVVMLMASMSAMPIFISDLSNHTYDKYMLAISLAEFKGYYQDAKLISKIVPPNGSITYSLLKATSNPEPFGNQLLRHFNIALTHQLGAPYSLVNKRFYSENAKYRKQVASINQKYGYKKVNVDLQFFDLYTQWNSK